MTATRRTVTVATVTVRCKMDGTVKEDQVSKLAPVSTTNHQDQ